VWAAMVAVPANQGRCADCGDDNGQHAMGFLFRWKEMGEDCREGEKDGREQAVNNAQAGCPDAEVIGGNGKSLSRSGRRDRVPAVSITHG